MWSGPRNISTALMRSWENRSDCAVIDEPLYAHYLDHTGLQHPGRDDVLEAQPRSWRLVAKQLCGPAPDGAQVWYQKHMAHHLLPVMEREWLLALEHCFLIRSPGAVLSSYIRSRDEVRLEDLGFVQQYDLFTWLREQTGQTPLVIESSDILRRPEVMLRALCQVLKLPFEDSMLAWPAGSRETDGVWAPHWYASVCRSTGFKPYQEPTLDYPEAMEPIVQAALPHYRALRDHRLLP
jgi:hypothetical protein